MTGSALYAYILRTLKRTDKETEVYEAITDTVRDIRQEFSPEDDKDIAYCTGITTLGQYYLDLPSDFQWIIGDVRILDNDDSYPLRKYSKAAYDTLFPNQQSTTLVRGKPWAYCIYANRVFLGPVPDLLTYQYEINYSKDGATAIVAGTAAVPYSSTNADMLKCGTLFRLFRDLGVDDEMMKWSGMYEVEKMKFKKNEDDNLRGPELIQYRGM